MKAIANRYLNAQTPRKYILDVQPIYENRINFILGGKKGIITEYGSKNEKKLDREKQNGSTSDKGQGNKIRYKKTG